MKKKLTEREVAKLTAPGIRHAGIGVAATAERGNRALSSGDWSPLAVAGEVLAYARTFEQRRILVVLNLDAAPKTVRFEERLSGRIELSTDPRRAHERVGDRLELGADEGVIVVPA